MNQALKHVNDFEEGWGHLDLKGRKKRWGYMERRLAFGVTTIRCSAQFPQRGEIVEYFNADTLFMFTPHSQERVRKELAKIERRPAEARHAGEGPDHMAPRARDEEEE